MLFAAPPHIIGLRVDSVIRIIGVYKSLCFPVILIACRSQLFIYFTTIQLQTTPAGHIPYNH